MTVDEPLGLISIDAVADAKAVEALFDGDNALDGAIGRLGQPLSLADGVQERRPLIPTCDRGKTARLGGSFRLTHARCSPVHPR
jgi:hypothetical protein